MASSNEILGLSADSIWAKSLEEGYLQLRKIGNGPLPPEAAILTLFLPTVTLEFKTFGLGLACV